MLWLDFCARKSDLKVTASVDASCVILVYVWGAYDAWSMYTGRQTIADLRMSYFRHFVPPSKQ